MLHNLKSNYRKREVNKKIFNIKNLSVIDFVNTAYKKNVLCVQEVLFFLYRELVYKIGYILNIQYSLAFAVHF